MIKRHIITISADVDSESGESDIEVAIDPQDMGAGRLVTILAVVLKDQILVSKPDATPSMVVSIVNNILFAACLTEDSENDEFLEMLALKLEGMNAKDAN